MLLYIYLSYINIKNYIFIYKFLLQKKKKKRKNKLKIMLNVKKKDKRTLLLQVKKPQNLRRERVMEIVQYLLKILKRNS